MFYGGASDGKGAAPGRGGKREKLAGYLRAANELRQSYQNSYMNRDDTYDDSATISDAFPHLKLSQNGTEEMVLFPSYARPHVRTSQPVPNPGVVGGDDLRRDPGDAEFWRREWEIHEDANAVVDVDVRGWIYTPTRGQLGRRNRLLMSVARRLSGVPAPGGSQSSSRSSSATRENRERDEEAAERKAREIAARGEHEADIGSKGGFSERPYSENYRGRESPMPGNIRRPATDPSFDSDDAGSLISGKSSIDPSTMSVEEIAVANRFLAERMRPFMTTPVADMTVTIFFYNNETSQSRSARTNESGHFNFRAALAFVPTDVRVLSSEGLSASEEVAVTESHGVSVISDIDDTIKHSAISAGAREIFRNAFVRDLQSLQIDGVKDWYWSMVKLGAKMHYVSNSPWQMFPLLDAYFHDSGLPPGSLHLKEYSGMLQGVFEPVAERKRGTIDRILSDFPERKFILIGDSGEADLEVYTETALMNPNRILGIFIRDVTTDPKVAFFESTPPAGTSGGKQASGSSGSSAQGGSSRPPPLPPRPGPLPTRESAPDLGDLIDFSDSDTVTASKITSQPSADTKQTTAAAKARPPPPSKPHALRVNSFGLATTEQPALKATASETNIPHTTRAGNIEPPQASIPRKPAPPVPPPRRQASKLSETRNADQPTDSTSKGSTDSQQESEFKQPPPLPARKPWPGQEHATAAIQYASRKVWSGGEAGTAAQTPQERRIALWNQRWARAEVSLKAKGIILRTWRLGKDAQKAAEDLIRDAQKSR